MHVRSLVLAVWGCALCLPAHAASIHFINPSPPPQSQVIGAVEATASGFTIGPQTLSQLTATSISTTTLGPIPPPFTAITNARAELASDLFLASPGTTRNITAPFSTLGFFAEGTGTTGADSYTVRADAYSGDTSSVLPGTWTIHVDPTGLEIAGTPTLITIDASIVGDLEVVGTSTADATWLISTNFGTVMNGAASQTAPGLSPFSDTGTLSFIIPLGGTFQLTLLYQLDAGGVGVSNSRAEILASTGSTFRAFGPLALDPPDSSFLTITAEVGVAAVPEPSSLALLAMGLASMSGVWRRRRGA